MDARMQARRVLELDLRTALGHGEFELFYQPLVDLDERRRHAASRRCCAGAIPSAAWSRRPSSSRWPRRSG